jgi:hypothetical protein
MEKSNKLSSEMLDFLKQGTVIPACPLALHEDKSFDEYHQRILPHYYIDAGSGGIAVGVHTTQFEIRDSKYNLFETVLRVVSEEIDKERLEKPFLKIAGICGDIKQALLEVNIAKKYGYDIALLSLAGLDEYSEEELLERTRIISEKIPVFGFYLQQTISGRTFSFDFWKKFSEIDNVIAIKTAPFNRYQTLDVVRAVCESHRNKEISIYTGNDDNIVSDLLTKYCMTVDGQRIEKEFSGGLLGHWAVWNKRAVELFSDIKDSKDTGKEYSKLLLRGTQITDCNAAFFDSKNGFKGSIAGINEVLSRQGLLEGNYCLSDHEILSPGQMEEIDRVYINYPELNDNSFVKENFEKWTKFIKGDL